MDGPLFVNIPRAPYWSHYPYEISSLNGHTNHTGQYHHLINHLYTSNLTCNSLAIDNYLRHQYQSHHCPQQQHELNDQNSEVESGKNSELLMKHNCYRRLHNRLHHYHHNNNNNNTSLLSQRYLNPNYSSVINEAELNENRSPHHNQNAMKDIESNCCLNSHIKSCLAQNLKFSSNFNEFHSNSPLNNRLSNLITNSKSNIEPIKSSNNKINYIKLICEKQSSNNMYLENENLANDTVLEIPKAIPLNSIEIEKIKHLSIVDDDDEQSFNLNENKLIKNNNFENKQIVTNNTGKKQLQTNQSRLRKKINKICTLYNLKWKKLYVLFISNNLNLIKNYI